MVRFNSSKKLSKPKRAVKKANETVSVKQNQPKLVFEESFLKWRYFVSVAFLFGGGSG